MTTQIAVRLDNEITDEIDRAVGRGEFPNRTAAVREALKRLAHDLREQDIAAEYRRAYTEQPQEPWVGAVGVALLAAAVSDEPEL